MWDGRENSRTFHSDGSLPFTLLLQTTDSLKSPESVALANIAGRPRSEE